MWSSILPRKYSVECGVDEPCEPLSEQNPEKQDNQRNSNRDEQMNRWPKAASTEEANHRQGDNDAPSEKYEEECAHRSAA